MPSGQLVVGTVNGVYGVKGWIRIFSYTDPLEQIFAYQSWQLRKHSSIQVIALSQGKKHGKGLVALPIGCTDRKQAELLIGSDILICKAQLPELVAGDYYWHELAGLAVVNPQGEVFGQVVKLLETGANDVLVVTATTDSVDEKERLIPYVLNEIVLEVNLKAGQIIVAWGIDY